MLLTTDSVFLSLLTAAQRKEIPYQDSLPAKRCQPWSKKALLAPDFVYPAAVSVYLAGAKLLDNFYDEKSRSSKALFTLQKKTIRKAEETLRGFGLTLPPVEALISQQLRREAVTGRELSHYSEVTEEVTSRVFAHTATLAGMVGNYDHLAEVGRHAARIAYLVDGYADLRSDGARGLFNPFNDAVQPPKSVATEAVPDSKQMLVDHLSQSFSAIRDQVRRVKLYRFEDAIRHTVTDGLQARVSHHLANARTYPLRPKLLSLAPFAFAIAFGLLTNSLVHASSLHLQQYGFFTTYTTTTTRTIVEGPAQPGPWNNWAWDPLAGSTTHTTTEVNTIFEASSTRDTGMCDCGC